MTVIAWDGKTLAADKQGTKDGVALTVTKIHRVTDGLVALTGHAGHSHAILEWIKKGRDLDCWPKPGSEPGDAILFTKHGSVLVFDGEGNGVPGRLQDKMLAFGSGRDFALAAMHLGCNAVRAVEVACELNVYCGMGIDSLEMEK